MRAPRVIGAVAAAFLALSASLAPSAGAQPTVFTGQWQCDDRGAIMPLDGMNVELWKRGWDWLPVEISGSRVARGYTREDGTFRMTTPRDEDNYFVRMALRDAHGVHLKDFVGINDWSVDSSRRRNDRAVQDLGGLRFSTPGQSHKCAIWAGVHHAYEDYRAAVGSPLPSRGVEIQADAITAGVPFTPHTSIWWPGGYPAGHGAAPDDSTTRHEFAHVIRHGFDGDLGHFLGDVATHNYLQHHSACNKTGLGFAFNEGWAEYWERDIPAPGECPWDDEDWEVEGNVARALTELEARCAAGRRDLMVDVLRRNPGRIHSYPEFAALFGCPLPAPLPVLRLPPGVTAAVVGDARRAKLARLDLRLTGKRIGRLGKVVRNTTRLSQRPPRCIRAGCLKALRIVTRPAGQRLELALARIHKAAIDDLDTPKEQLRLRNMGTVKLVRWAAKREAVQRRKTVKAALGATKGVLAAVRGAGSSKLTRRLRRDMTKAAARFRRALKGGAKALPPSLTLSPFTAKPPRRAKRLPAVPPLPPLLVPFPGDPDADGKVDSDMDISCPDDFTQGPPFEVSGKLTPAEADSEVEVTFDRPGASSVTKTVETDGDGEWEASHPTDKEVGTWTVEAEFDGDDSREPASDSCQAEVGPFI